MRSVWKQPRTFPWKLFLDCLVARRGIPTNIRSYCGTNYVGATGTLKSLFKEAAVKYPLHARILCQWSFNRPVAPQFGGIWAAIICVKLHMKKEIRSQVYTLEEFITLITRVEGEPNLRPLVAASSDPNNLCALMPGHFQIGQLLMEILDSDFTNVSLNRLRRWQLVAQIILD